MCPACLTSMALAIATGTGLGAGVLRFLLWARKEPQDEQAQR